MAWLTAWPRPCQADQTTKLLTASPTVESVEPGSSWGKVLRHDADAFRGEEQSLRSRKDGWKIDENSVSWGIRYYICAPEYYGWKMVRILFLVSYYEATIMVFGSFIFIWEFHDDWYTMIVAFWCSWFVVFYTIFYGGGKTCPIITKYITHHSMILHDDIQGS